MGAKVGYVNCHSLLACAAHPARSYTQLQRIQLARFVSTFVLATAVTTSHAVVIGGIDFPDGNASFADSVASFTPGWGGGGAAAAFLEGNNALGAPDVNTTNGLQCFLSPSTTNCLFASLGNGGNLVLRFTDNLLTGSSAPGSVTGIGDGFNDLYVFEVGVAEQSTVEISQDGTTWFNVGNIAGGGGSSTGIFTYGFDIDVLGFGYTDAFTWVRITDFIGDVNTSPAGADIDAVGAIQSPIPLPGAAWFLPLMGAALLRWTRRRR